MLYNGEGYLYDYSNVISNYAIAHAKTKIDNSEFIIMMISVSCIVIVGISLAFVIPSSFYLDNEEL